MSNVTETLLEIRLETIAEELLRHSRVCQVCSASSSSGTAHRIARLVS